MLFRKLVGLSIFLCMSLSCSPDKSPKHVTKRCTCHSNDDEYTVLKLHLMHIDAQDAKRVCDDIIAAIDYEFSSINVAADSCTNSLILTGRAYEVHLLEYNLRQKERVFRDNEYTLSVLKLVHIDVQDAKKLCDDVIVSTDEFASISIATESRTNSLILTGRAYEVYLLEEHIVRHIDTSPL